MRRCTVRASALYQPPAYLPSSRRLYPYYHSAVAFFALKTSFNSLNRLKHAALLLPGTTAAMRSHRSGNSFPNCFSACTNASSCSSDHSPESATTFFGFAAAAAPAGGGAACVLALAPKLLLLAAAAAGAPAALLRLLLASLPGMLLLPLAISLVAASPAKLTYKQQQPKQSTSLLLG